MSNIQTTTKSSKIIFLFGPTGVGKTELIETYFTKNYQIINADSKQIYRKLDIGSAKPSAQLLQKIKHHLVDIKEPNESFSVGEFVKLADEAVTQIVDQNQIPLISGGTAYYFKHFYYGLPPSPKSDEKTRLYVKTLLDEKGELWCYQKLQEVDPVTAKKIYVSDHYRLTRALEVYYSSGKPLSSFKMPTQPRNNMKPLIIGLERDREELNQRIALRVNQMFAQGLKEEIKKIKTMGADESWPAIQGIGYKEFFIEGLNEEQIKHEIIKNSRRYAKRQMTFFRSIKGVHWVHPDNKKQLSSLIDNYIQ